MIVFLNLYGKYFRKTKTSNNIKTKLNVPDYRNLVHKIKYKSCNINYIYIGQISQNLQNGLRHKNHVVKKSLQI